MSKQINESKNTAAYVASDNGTVDVSCVTQHPDGDVVMNTKRGTLGMRCHWTIDFKDVTEEEIRELASRTVVIEYRKHWRGLSPEVSASMANDVVSVREVLDRQRKPRQPKASATPLETALLSIDIMTPEQRRILVQKLGLSSSD